MPTVIDLLSSSPPRQTATSSPKFTRKSGEDALPRYPDDHAYPRSDKSGTYATEPLAGTKRTSSYHPRHDDNDFLFLSDEFDTTGDLDASFAKKPRVSQSPMHVRKKVDALAVAKPEPAKAVPSFSRNSLQPAITKRMNLAEDIFSSSPVDMAPLENRKKAPILSSDPFLSPQGDRKLASMSQDIYNDKHDGAISGRKGKEGSSTREHTEIQKSRKAPLIDLSSDPLASPPQRKTQPDISRSRPKSAWDPISSSAPDICDLLSSPPVSREAKQPQSRRTDTIGSDSDSDSDDLPDLKTVDFSNIGTFSRSTSSSSRPKSDVRARKPKPAGQSAALSAEEKARERKRKAEEREAERGRKRIEKEQAKEERALQKQKEKALAEVNKLRTDKKVSTPEMIVDIPATIDAGLKFQIEALLGDLDVQFETWDSGAEDVVRWRRKIKSRFNEDMGLWEPVPLSITDEAHVMILLQAKDFVKFSLGGEGQDLEAHVLRTKTRFPKAKLIYLIEGLTPWMRKNRNVLNRQFASAVRNLAAADNAAGPSSGQSRRRTNNQTQEYIDEDKIEDALLCLQVSHEVLIHHTNAQVETAQWVAVFTQHISTIPYRKARDDSTDAGFCMASGQVRTGEDAKDTYVRMLQEITRVTAPIAYGIVAKYPTLPELVRGFEEEGPMAVAECRKSANKDGALTDRTVGQALSKRLHKILLGRDPASTEV
ncbi:hypothetical protein GGS20DRAFT_55201 [Poronia punctata]|nr:hypothetical protein GGS20DRAFT_55201 [Poronia punctata]